MLSSVREDKPLGGGQPSNGNRIFACPANGQSITERDWGNDPIAHAGHHVSDRDSRSLGKATKKSIEQMGQSCPYTGPLAYPALYLESVLSVWFSVFFDFDLPWKSSIFQKWHIWNTFSHVETHRIRFQPQPAQT